MKSFSFPAYCRKQRISYEQLADLLGISRSYACQIRLGRKPVSAKIAARIKATLGLSMDVTLDGVNRERQEVCRKKRKAERS